MEADSEPILVDHQDHAELSMEFKAGESIEAMREKVFKLWGQGVITDPDAYIVTDNTGNLLPGHYTFSPAVHTAAGGAGAGGSAGTADTEICRGFALMTLAVGIPLHLMYRLMRHSEKVLLAIQGQQDPGINKFLSAVEAASFVGVVATSVRSLCAGIGKHLRPHKRPQSKPALKPADTNKKP